MPTYEYRCHECEHQFEVFQKMSDDPVSDCEVCGGAVRRVLFPVAIHFKGSGFYTTDYARKKTLPATNGNGSSEPSDSNGNGSSDHVESGGNGSSRVSGSSSSEDGGTKGGASKKVETSAKKGSVVSSKTGDS
ncbi:MAG: FmdB family zinc ribbon protein [Thermoleophilia bacterium]